MHIRETRKYDVVVCGCGVAGFSAAVAAGRQGKKVALVERQGMPGGILTVGGNDEIALFFAHKHLVIKGIGWEFSKELVRRGYGIMPDWHTETRHPALGVKVNPLAAASLMDEWMTTAGVELYYNQPVVDCDVSDGRVERVIIGAKQGPVALEAKTFVDCTGDADLCAFAGADIECGDPETGDLMPGTLRYYQQQIPNTPDTLQKIAASFKAARADGRLRYRDLWNEGPDSTGDLLYFHDGNNIGHVMHYNAADSDSLTQAEIRGRQSVMRVSDWIRGNGLGGEVITAAPNVASRESRRVVCDTRVSAEDYVAGRMYDDAVCYSFYPIDLHKAEGGCLFNIFIEEGVYPTLPLSMMIPTKLSNVLVAGRCASGDRLAQSAFRVKSSCMAMGEAAGVTAALAGDGEVRGVPVGEVRAVLRRNGCLVPPDAPQDEER